MKTKLTILTALVSALLASNLFAQEPNAAASPIATPAVTMTASATPAAIPSATAKEDLESRIERSVKHHGVTIDLGPSVARHHSKSNDDDLGGLLAIPIVGIIFGSIFFSPVFIVGIILLFSYARQRSLHRTVRMMVEKGQPVPPELFAATPRIRARNDMRRGITLIMVGIGIMVFFGAVNDWEGGSWALGMIPFLIGAGYLTVWKLEGNKPGLTSGSVATPTQTGTDIPPRVP